MAILRRRALPEHLVPVRAAFDGVLVHVEAAKGSATGAVPTGRAPGTPLAEALFGFRECILRARKAMPGWRADEVEDVWIRCSAGIDEALEACDALRMSTQEMSFEGLLEAITELIAPLDPFEVADERFLELKR